MEKYNGLTKVTWYVCGFTWSTFLSQILGLDVA